MHGWRLQQSTDKCRDPSPPKHAPCSKRPISARKKPCPNWPPAAMCRFLQGATTPKHVPCSKWLVLARSPSSLTERINAKCCKPRFLPVGFAQRRGSCRVSAPTWPFSRKEPQRCAFLRGKNRWLDTNGRQGSAREERRRHAKGSPTCGTAPPCQRTRRAVTRQRGMRPSRRDAMREERRYRGPRQVTGSGYALARGWASM